MNFPPTPRQHSPGFLTMRGMLGACQPGLMFVDSHPDRRSRGLPRLPTSWMSVLSLHLGEVNYCSLGSGQIHHQQEVHCKDKLGRVQTCTFSTRDKHTAWKKTDCLSRSRSGAIASVPSQDMNARQGCGGSHRTLAALQRALKARLF